MLLTTARVLRLLAMAFAAAMLGYIVAVELGIV
jgi:hypothetical protein